MTNNEFKIDKLLFKVSANGNEKKENENQSLFAED
jgi:hypothetical protein